MPSAPLAIIANSPDGLTPAVREWFQQGGCPGLDILLWDAPLDEAIYRLEKTCGLVLLGGSDLAVETGAYTREGEVSPDTLYSPNPHRDTLELALARIAWERDMGILGLCRGFQLINVALGGSLVPDMESRWGAEALIPEHRLSGREMASAEEEDEEEDRIHSVQVVAGGILGQCVGSNSVIPVLSHHHQALDQVAAVLAVDARSADGVAESFYARERQHVVGLQSHPEQQLGQTWGVRWLSAWLKLLP